MFDFDKALRHFRSGKPVLIFDFENREGETDIAIPAVNVRPKDVTMMRIDGGGLICVAIHPLAAKKLGLPFMHDILRIAGEKITSIKKISRFNDIKYDRKSSFSLWINHRDTFTGITDSDRALTIRRVGEAVDAVMTGHEFDFGNEFRSPGHVALLRAAENLVFNRFGQTELSVALAEMAGIPPAVAICEMLDSNSGKALSKENAIRYAEQNGIPFVDGKTIIRNYKKFVKDRKLFV